MNLQAIDTHSSDREIYSKKDELIFKNRHESVGCFAYVSSVSFEQLFNMKIIQMDVCEINTCNFYYKNNEWGGLIQNVCDGHQ